LKTGATTGNPSPQISVGGVQVLDDNLLQVSLVLDILNDLDVALKVDVDLSLFGPNGLLFAGSSPAFFQGTAGESSMAFFHVNSTSLLDADVALNVQLGNLLALNLDVDVDLSSIGLGNLVGNLVNGVVQLVDGLLGGLLNGLLGGLLGSQTPQIQVSNIQSSGNGNVQADFTLQNSAIGGISTNVVVKLVDSDGVVLFTSVNALVFSGVAGQVVSLNLDLSAAIGLFGCDTFIQVSLEADILGIIQVDLNVNVNLSGLNNLLDSILGNLVPADFSCSNDYYSSYTSDYSTNAYTTNFSTQQTVSSIAAA